MNYDLGDALLELEDVAFDLTTSFDFLGFAMEEFEEENPSNNHAQDAYTRMKNYGLVLLDRLQTESERLKAACEVARKAAAPKEAK